MTGRILGIVLSLTMLFGSGAGYIAPHEDPTGTLVLVNKQNRAPSAKPDLVLPDIPPSRAAIADNLYMRPDAAQAIEALFSAAKEEAGLQLYGISGYRSYATQKSIYERRIDESGDSAKNWVAPPGHSEHQTGLAMDITGETNLAQGLANDFGESPEGLWVAQNAHHFGFIIRYKKGWERITGYGYEPWHIRYVGEEHATAMYEADCTLEEYLEALRLLRLTELLPQEVRAQGDEDDAL